jgi:iron transport multicopper oxidase
VYCTRDDQHHIFSHLHGHKFQIVGRSEDYSSDDPALNPPIVEGQENPMRRDTIMIPPMGSATLRIIADNPGAWFFHCKCLHAYCGSLLKITGHIEWHLESGLAVQIIEAPLLAQQRNAVPQLMYDNCKVLNRPFSGNAAGFASAADLDGLPLGPYMQRLGWHAKGIGAMFAYASLHLTMAFANGTSLPRCILSAVLGMATVVWYPLGGLSDEEVEQEVRAKIAAKANRGRFFGLLPRH